MKTGSTTIQAINGIKKTISRKNQANINWLTSSRKSKYSRMPNKKKMNLLKHLNRHVKPIFRALNQILMLASMISLRTSLILKA